MWAAKSDGYTYFAHSSPDSLHMFKTSRPQRDSRLFYVWYSLLHALNKLKLWNLKWKLWSFGVLILDPFQPDSWNLSLIQLSVLPLLDFKNPKLFTRIIHRLPKPNLSSKLKSYIFVCMGKFSATCAIVCLSITASQAKPAKTFRKCWYLQNTCSSTLCMFWVLLCSGAPHRFRTCTLVAPSTAMSSTG